MIERKSLLTMLGERRNKVKELNNEVQYLNKIVNIQQLRLDKMKDIIEHPDEYVKDGSV